MTVTVQAPSEVTGPEAPQAVTPPAPASERPDWLPEKFATPEDLANSYKELETRLSSPPAPAPEAPPQVAQGFDWEAVEREFMQSGKLSDERYAELEQAGIDRNFADRHVSAVASAEAAALEAVFTSVGGKEEFSKAATWAKSNIPASEVEAFNKIVEAGTPDTIQIAVKGLMSMYREGVGTEPKLVGGGGASAAPEGFASRAQMVEAIRDPRYRKDEAYRSEVQAKLNVASFW
jgi:hypothetical protein